MVDQRILASDSAELLGRLSAMLFLPVLGAVLVIIGLRKRSQARRASSTADRLPTDKSSATRLLVIGSIVFLFGLFAILASAATRVNESRQGEVRQGETRQVASGLSVGECTTSSDLLAERWDPKPIDCGSEAAKYEVVFVGDGAATCPDGERDRSVYSLRGTSSQTLCFIANFSEGSCYNYEVGAVFASPESCTRPQANMKVERRIDGTTDAAQCPEGSLGLSYPEPPRLFCMRAP